MKQLKKKNHWKNTGKSGNFVSACHLPNCVHVHHFLKSLLAIRIHGQPAKSKITVYLIRPTRPVLVLGDVMPAICQIVFTCTASCQDFDARIGMISTSHQHWLLHWYFLHADFRRNNPMWSTPINDLHIPGLDICKFSRLLMATITLRMSSVHGSQDPIFRNNKSYDQWWIDLNLSMLVSK